MSGEYCEYLGSREQRRGIGRNDLHSIGGGHDAYKGPKRWKRARKIIIKVSAKVLYNSLLALREEIFAPRVAVPIVFEVTFFFAEFSQKTYLT